MSDLPEPVRVPPYQACTPASQRHWPSHKQRGLPEFPTSKVTQTVPLRVERIGDDIYSTTRVIPEHETLNSRKIDQRIKDVAFWAAQFVGKDVDIRLESLTKTISEVNQYAQELGSTMATAVARVPQQVIAGPEFAKFKAQQKSLEGKIADLEGQVAALQEELGNLRSKL